MARSIVSNVSVYKETTELQFIISIQNDFDIADPIVSSIQDGCYII